MQKNKLNLIIDFLLLICLLLISGIGFLIRYVLPPGFARKQLYGSGVDLQFWGLDRHEWGNIHLIISFVFIGLLFFHILLHWKMICAFTLKHSQGKISSKVLLGIVLALSAICLVGPFCIQPEVTPHQGRIVAESITPINSEQTPTHSSSTIEVKGSMHLNELASQFQVSTSTIIAQMGISPKDSCQRIGRLKKKYGFTMHELKQLIELEMNN